MDFVCACWVGVCSGPPRTESITSWSSPPIRHTYTHIAKRKRCVRDGTYVNVVSHLVKGSVAFSIYHIGWYRLRPSLSNQPRRGSSSAGPSSSTVWSCPLPVSPRYSHFPGYSPTAPLCPLRTQCTTLGPLRPCLLGSCWVRQWHLKDKLLVSMGQIYRLGTIWTTANHSVRCIITRPSIINLIIMINVCVLYWLSSMKKKYINNPKNSPSPMT